MRQDWLLKVLLMAPLAAAPVQGVAGAQSGNAPVCAGCHRDVWETYRRTGMGRSFYRPSPENMIEDFRDKNTFYHQASDSYFTMLQRGGEHYQRRYQIDSRGKQVNVMEKRIDYIMGSGNHARAYFHRTAANTLIQLPLGWYAEKGGYWGMNPGYDRPDHDGFRRPITYDCMFCHNAYPPIPAGHEQPFAQSVYTGSAAGRHRLPAVSWSGEPAHEVGRDRRREAARHPQRHSESFPAERRAADGDLHVVPSGDHQLPIAERDSAI